MSLNINTRNVKVERYFPAVLSNAKEFISIAEVENPEINAVWAEAVKWMLNTFVYDIDMAGAERWEDMLKIVPGKGDSLSKRKQRILMTINHSLPYTERSFQQMLDGVYGEGRIKIRLNYNKYELWLDLSAPVMSQNKSIRVYARAIIPANLIILISKSVEVELEQYVGAVASWSHIVTIPAAQIVDFNDFTASIYTAGAVGWNKFITIRGI